MYLISIYISSIIDTTITLKLPIAKVLLAVVITIAFLGTSTFSSIITILNKNYISNAK